MSQWKSKVSMPTQMGKACLAHQASIGVRGLALVGPELVCPSGEQITNGGFETGDLTGWTATNSEVVTYNPHTGTYSVRPSQNTGSIEQDFINEVPAACIVSSSVFELYVRGQWGYSPPYGSKFTFRLKYTDDTETVIVKRTTADENGSWVKVDLKSYVETGKTLKGIKITLDRRWIGQMYADDVSLIP